MQNTEQVQSRLKVGDTIQCSCDLDMIMVSQELAKEGIFTDWLNIKDAPPERYKLTVVGVEINLQEGEIE